MARDARDDAKKLLARRIDPSAARKQAKLEAFARAANSFEWVARA